jgi:class 3 adenylate cyclase
VSPDFLFMHIALSLASGWAMAASGRLSEAVASVQQAARLARDRAQPTHELACIQAAAQWGDTSQAARARELAGALSLPLADAVALHAETLLARDGEGLLAASAAYRRIGDRAAAADAAAQASVAFAESHQRKRGLYAAAVNMALHGAHRHHQGDLAVGQTGHDEFDDIALGLPAGGGPVTRGTGVDHPIRTVRRARLTHCVCA